MLLEVVPVHVYLDLRIIYARHSRLVRQDIKDKLVRMEVLQQEVAQLSTVVASVSTDILGLTVRRQLPVWLEETDKCVRMGEKSLGFMGLVAVIVS